MKRIFRRKRSSTTGSPSAVSSSTTDDDDSSIFSSRTALTSTANTNTPSQDTTIQSHAEPPQQHPQTNQKSTRPLPQVPRVIPFLFPTFADLPGLLVSSSRTGPILRQVQWQQIRQRYIDSMLGQNRKHSPSEKIDPTQNKEAPHAPTLSHKTHGDQYTLTKVDNEDGTSSMHYDERYIIQIPITSESGHVIGVDEVEVVDDLSEIQVIPSELDAFIASHQVESDKTTNAVSKSTVKSEREKGQQTFYPGIYVALFALLLIIFSYTVIGLLILCIPEKPEHPYTCPTPNCKRMGHWIKSAMDTSLHPCDDFYHFACGTYVKNNPVSETKEELEDRILYREGIPVNFRENVMVGNVLKKVNKFPVNQLLLYYQACIDIQRREKHGVKPLIHLLSQIRLTVLQSGAYYSLVNRFNVARVMGQIFSKTNKLFFFDLDNIKDNRIMFKLARPPQEVIRTSAKVYAEMMTKTWRAFSKHLYIDGEEEIKTIVYLVMKFEAEITIIQSKETEGYIFGFPAHFDQVVPPPTKFHPNFIEMRGRFEWSELVGAIMGYPPGTFKEHPVTFNWFSSFYSKQDRYYALLVMEKLQNTPAYILFRYFQWGLMKLFAFDLNKEVQTNMLNIFRARGLNVVERCFGSVFSNLHILAAHRYKTMISDTVTLHNNVTAIADKIFRTYRETVTYLNLPLTMKASLLATAKTLQIVTIDANSEWEQYMNVFYKELNCTKEHFPNVVQARSIKAKNLVLSITKEFPYNRWWNIDYSLTEWTEMSIADAISTTRFLQVPFAGIQEPFFGNDLPILNYAGFGHYLISSALIKYAIDDLFQVYESNLRVSEPLDEVYLIKDFQKTFLQISECVIDSQSKIRLKDYPELHVNKENRETRMRMLTQTFALELTVLVMNKLLHATELMEGSVKPYKSPMDELLHGNQIVDRRFPQYQFLPGLEKYSPLQIVFLSMARHDCQAYTKARAASRLKHGPLLKEISIHGSFRNLKEFAQVWECPKKSFMNPRKRCQLFKGEQTNERNDLERGEILLGRGKILEHTNGDDHYYYDEYEDHEIT